jgi:putative amide transporter protein
LPAPAGRPSQNEKKREASTMLLGLALLYVGAVLFLNGLWLMGQIADREIAIINVFAGGVTLLVALYSAFGPVADAASIKAAALTLLFTFTYLWVAFNRYSGADGRGLGWFSLFVAITVVPVAFDTLTSAQTFWDFWFGICWASWAVLWFMFFLLLAQQRPIARVTGMVTAAQGVYTGWLPGYLLLDGVMGPAAAVAAPETVPLPVPETQSMLAPLHEGAVQLADLAGFVVPRLL